MVFFTLSGVLSKSKKILLGFSRRSIGAEDAETREPTTNETFRDQDRSVAWKIDGFASCPMARSVPISEMGFDPRTDAFTRSTIERIRGSIMSNTLHGKVHGKLIELDQDPGLAEGQEVEITVRPIESGTSPRSGEGLLRTEGVLADDQEWDGIIEEIYLDRKRDRRREVAE
jgi:hypothetical protein